MVLNDVSDSSEKTSSRSWPSPSLQKAPSKKSQESFLQTVITTVRRIKNKNVKPYVKIKPLDVSSEPDPTTFFPLGSVKNHRSSKEIARPLEEETEENFVAEGEWRKSNKVVDKEEIEWLRRKAKFWSGSTKKDKTPECIEVLKQIDALSKFSLKGVIGDEEFSDLYSQVNTLKREIQEKITAWKVNAIATDALLEIDRGKAKRILVKAPDRKDYVLYSSIKSFFSFLTGNKEKELEREFNQIQNIKKKVLSSALEKFLDESFPEEEKELILKGILESETSLNTLFEDPEADELRKNLKIKISLAEKLKEYIGNADPTEKDKFLTSGSTLAIDMKKLPKELEVDGKPTYIARKASKYRNLERLVKTSKEPLSFEQALNFGSQILNGYKDLEGAGIVHGDTKLENILVYKDKDKNLIARVADFGKAREMEKDETAINTGNDRYMQGLLSHKSQLFGVGILLIRLTETQFLTKDQKMLIDPEEEASIKPSKQRWGIERFLILNKKTPQTESSKLKGRIRILFRAVQYSVKKPAPQKFEASSQEIQKYVAALTEQLKAKYPDQEEALDELKKLLNNLTSANPKGSIADAAEKFEEIRKNFV